MFPHRCSQTVKGNIRQEATAGDRDWYRQTRRSAAQVHPAGINGWSESKQFGNVFAGVQEAPLQICTRGDVSASLRRLDVVRQIPAVIRTSRCGTRLQEFQNRINSASESRDAKEVEVGSGVTTGSYHTNINCIQHRDDTNRTFLQS